jgi:hypothetical protein
MGRVFEAYPTEYGIGKRSHKLSGPVRFAAKQKPHRPGIAPALGLRAG